MVQSKRLPKPPMKPVDASSRAAFPEAAQRGSSRVASGGVSVVQSTAAPTAPLHLTVTQLAADLGITPRTLRFYEGKGLISPNRLGTTRAYTARDRARMVLILRGKRLGFSLKEIAEYLNLYDIDPTLRVQNERLLKLVSARISKLEQQRAALEEMLAELHEYKAHAQAMLQASRDLTPGSSAPGFDITTPVRSDRSRP